MIGWCANCCGKNVTQNYRLIVLFGIGYLQFVVFVFSKYFI